MLKNVEMLYKDNFLKINGVNSILHYENIVHENPQISIIIPTFQRNELLKESVLSAVNQAEYDDYEVIVVDNDPDSNSAKIIEYLSQFKDKTIRYYINDSNIGMFGNWNRGLMLAMGSWVVILNDDDLLYSGFLSNYSKFIHDDIGVIKGLVSYDNQELIYNPFWYNKSLKIYNIMIRPYLGVSNCLLYNKNSLIKLGGFDDSNKYIADLVMLFRVVDLYGGYQLNESYSYYREEGQNTCKSPEWINIGSNAVVEMNKDIVSRINNRCIKFLLAYALGLKSCSLCGKLSRRLLNVL